MEVVDIKEFVFPVYKSPKNDKLISKLKGKVIIVRNSSKVREGFAEIVDYTDRENCYIANMQNVTFDYHKNIRLSEFKHALYGMGFKQVYREKVGENGTFHVYANVENGCMVTFELYKEGDDPTNKFKSVEVYVPTHNDTYVNHSRLSGFSRGDGEVCVFNIMDSPATYPIHAALSYMDTANKSWNKAVPNLANSLDKAKTWESDEAMIAECLGKLDNFYVNIGEIFGFAVTNTPDTNNTNTTNKEEV